MKLVSTLLAGVLVIGTAGIAAAQSGANPTPSGATPDKSISAATHCLDKGQPRLKTQTTGGNVAAGNAGVGDKSAKSTGTSSQSPQSPGSGKSMAANLPNC